MASRGHSSRLKGRERNADIVISKNGYGYVCIIHRMVRFDGDRWYILYKRKQREVLFNQKENFFELVQLFDWDDVV